MVDFSGQVAIITGASGLLASGVIPIFRGGGARLALTCGDDRLYERFPDLRYDSNHICVQTADLSDPQVVDSFIKRALFTFGRIDVLVNIVGGWDAGKPVHEMTLDTWETMIRLNSTITFLMSRAVMPTMLEQECGVIVNIGAQTGLALQWQRCRLCRLQSCCAALDREHVGGVQTPRHSGQRGAALGHCDS